jgi:hypothetical protein
MHKDHDYSKVEYKHVCQVNTAHTLVHAKKKSHENLTYAIIGGEY